MILEKLTVLTGYKVIVEENSYLILTVLYQNPYSDIPYTTTLMVHPGNTMDDMIIPREVLEDIVTNYDDHVIRETLYYRVY